MLKSLDIDDVRAFVLVADLASFTRAAEILQVAQAAVSLKIKRLETQLDYRLLDRTPRNVRLSKDGLHFIDDARELLDVHDRSFRGRTEPSVSRLSIGISNHVAGSDLPDVLSKLSAYDPTILMEVNIAASRTLVDAFDRGEFDAIIVRQECQSLKGTFLFDESVGWFASPAFKYHSDEALRLATLSESCSLRSIATQALDEAGIIWREAFVGGGVLTVGAAASAGLGVAPLAARLAPTGTIDVAKKFDLPELPNSRVIAATRSKDEKANNTIRNLVAAFRRP